jgi:murein DD-endopeptidase MepM/ murein hydrolase activator NlpD
VIYRYTHVRRPSKLPDGIESGAKVSEGQLVAYSGKSGNASTLPDDKAHVHLSVRPGGWDKKNYIDPIEHFKKYPSERVTEGLPR